MNKYHIYLSCLLPLIFFFLSCKNTNEEKVIAKVYDNILYAKDLENILPEGISGNDSISLVNNYVQQWIKERVVIEKAKKNIDKQFEKQLEDYKNSLIIYEYERHIVDKLLDTNISNEEIEKYYQKEKDNFLLKDNIVKVLYVKLNKNSTSINTVKKILFKSEINQKDKMEIEKIASISAVNFYFDDQKWLYFNDLLKEIPIETYNQELFLQNNRNISIVDNSYAYIVRIVDFKIKETLSPLSLEKDNIRSVLLNKRKVDIIDKMQQELLKEAEVNNEIKIFK